MEQYSLVKGVLGSPDSRLQKSLQDMFQFVPQKWGLHPMD